MLTEHLFLPNTYYHPQYEACMVFDEPDEDYYAYPSFLSANDAMLEAHVERERRRDIQQGYYEKDIYDQIVQRQREIEDRKRYNRQMLLLAREREKQELEQRMFKREWEQKVREAVQSRMYERQRQAEACRMIQRRQQALVEQAELKKEKQRQMEEEQHRKEESMRRFLASTYFPQHARRKDERNVRGSHHMAIPPVHVIRQMTGVPNTEESPRTPAKTESKLKKVIPTNLKPTTVSMKSSILIGGVEDVPIEEWDGDSRPDSIWKNRRPSPGNWMEPVEGFMG